MPVRTCSIGFDVAGWSKSRKEIAGITCFAGDGERRAFLERSDILVCLLPLTDETRGILDADLFAADPKPGSLRASPAPSALKASSRSSARSTADMAASVVVLRLFAIWIASYPYSTRVTRRSLRALPPLTRLRAVQRKPVVQRKRLAFFNRCLRRDEWPLCVPLDGSHQNWSPQSLPPLQCSEKVDEIEAGRVRLLIYR